MIYGIRGFTQTQVGMDYFIHTKRRITPLKMKEPKNNYQMLSSNV